MLFPTTIAGSLPKPEWLAEPNMLWAPWKSQGDELVRAKRDATMLAVKVQEDAGIDIVTEGEQARQHFVHGFLEKIEGIDFAHKVEMGIRKDRYKAMVPQVVAPLRLKSRVHADEARVARAHTMKKLKFTLPGPMTIIDTIADRYYGDRVKMAFAFADLLNEEAKALQADGVDLVQFDEPAFNVYMDEVNDWGIKALERAAQGLTCATAVHICYGYGIKANTDWKETLGAQWRQYEQIFPRDRRQPNPAGRDRVPQLEGAARPACAAQDQDRAGRRDRRRQPHGGDGRGCRAGDRRRVEIRTQEQHHRHHQLRHGADAARDRRSQADGARRRCRAGTREAGLRM
ncbi:methionine synthase II (cobalamin-independent) [Bradyrhizobium sp. GM22.5]